MMDANDPLVREVLARATARRQAADAAEAGRRASNAMAYAAVVARLQALADRLAGLEGLPVAYEDECVAPVQVTAGVSEATPDEFGPADYGEVRLGEFALLFQCRAGMDGYKPWIWGEWRDAVPLDEAVRLAVEALGDRAVGAE